MTRILGIETSCDETGASIVEDGRRVLSNVVASQHDLHARFRGVVPEIASRAHLERLGPVIDESLERAGVELRAVDAIAVGNRPGLIGSLIVGVSAAKALAWALDKPLVGVDHVRAHLWAANLYETVDDTPPPPAVGYPALGLVVSGGHTSLYEMAGPTKLRVIGRTIDDAVGEAYDKAAVILDLPYPGGPNLDKLAGTGDGRAYGFPRSMLGAESLDFSFSGLKTAVLYAVRGRPVGRGGEAHFERSANDLTEEERRDLAASFQAAAVDALIRKIDRAIDQREAGGETTKSLVIGGGVSANSLLRERVKEFGERRGIAVFVPAMRYCLDNAAMIAGLAHEQLQRGDVADLSLRAVARGGV